MHLFSALSTNLQNEFYKMKRNEEQNYSNEKRKKKEILPPLQLRNDALSKNEFLFSQDISKKEDTYFYLQG